MPQTGQEWGVSGSAGRGRGRHWSLVTANRWTLVTGLSRARVLAREQWLQIFDTQEQGWRSAVTTNGDTLFSSGWTEL